MKNKLWLVFILITIATWGVWGTFSDFQIKNGLPMIAEQYGIPEGTPVIPDSIVYIVWALTMVPCAIVALIINKGKFQHDWKSMLLGCTVGLLGAGGQLVLFKALTMGPSYIIFPFIAMSPVIVITLASIFLKEKATKWQVAGIIVALAAILLLSQESNKSGSVDGWVWIVLACLVLLAWGIQGFFMKFANNTMDAESIFVWMAISGLVLIPVAWFMNDDAAIFMQQEYALQQGGVAFGIQILNSIGALTLVYAYRHGKAVIVSPMEGLSPMVTVLLSLVVFSVIPNPFQIAGIVCAAFAMYALSR
ncbi:MAG: EamA family transporter [Paludibacteraceae bacterium]|nr:EamA family transporter [Paludibacteraceae bacterium]